MSNASILAIVHDRENQKAPILGCTFLKNCPMSFASISEIIDEICAVTKWKSGAIWEYDREAQSLHSLTGEYDSPHEDPLAGLELPSCPHALEGGQGRDPHAAGGLPRDARGLRHQALGLDRDELGPGLDAHAEDLVAGLDRGHAGPDGQHDTREVRPDATVLRASQAGLDASEHGLAPDRMPVDRIDR